MKTLVRIIIISFSIIMMGCDPIYTMYFANQSSVTVHAVVNYIVPYPDTSLPKTPSVSDLIPIKAGDTIPLLEDLGCSEELVFDVVTDGVPTTPLDTVSIYIIGADTVALYSWDTVAKYNMYLQRYDLSLSDLEGLRSCRCSSTLFFPPTEDMKHIHMWPPYGTYDEHGHRKDKKR